MIRVLIYLNDEDTQLCEIKIENTGVVAAGGMHQYHVEMATDRVDTVQFLTRQIWHWRTRDNVLGLLRQVLDGLPEDAFRLEGAIPVGPYRRKHNFLQILKGGKK